MMPWHRTLHELSIYTASRKKLGFRALLPIIPLDATLVRGSHGRDQVPEAEQPVLIGSAASGVSSATEVFHYLKSRCLS